MNKMLFLLRAKRDLLYNNKEMILQQTLEDSIDVSYFDFDKQATITNLKRIFTVVVDLCNECLMIQHQDELNQNQGTCNEYALIKETSEDSEEEKLEELPEQVVLQLTD